LKAGHITLDWSEADGTRWVSKVLVDPKTNKTEASLHPYNGGPIEAGPLQKNYLQALVKKLGSLDLFLCTAYAVQDSRSNATPPWSFLRAAKNDRRAVMTEILTLGRYAPWEAFAKDQAALLEKQLEGTRQQLLVLQASAEDVETYRAALAGMDDFIDGVRTALGKAKDRLQEASGALDKAQGVGRRRRRPGAS